MFILTPIAINSSLTSKRANVSSASSSSISSGSLRFLQFFPSTAPIEFPNVRETDKGLKPPFVLSSYDSFFFLHKHYLANPNGESVRNWILNNISKFHYNLMVNETRIVVLSRQLWVFTGKKKATMQKGIFLSSNMISKFPTVRMLGIGLWTWWSNFLTIQRWMSLRSWFFWDRFDGLQEKERVLKKEERKNEIEKQRKLRSQSENWPNMLLFIVRDIHDLLFTLNIYFYYFIKKKKLYFIPYQMNKSNVFFFPSNHYFSLFIYL